MKSSILLSVILILLLTACSSSKKSQATAIASKSEGAKGNTVQKVDAKQLPAKQEQPKVYYVK